MTKIIAAVFTIAASLNMRKGKFRYLLVHNEREDNNLFISEFCWSYKSFYVHMHKRKKKCKNLNKIKHNQPVSAQPCFLCEDIHLTEKTTFYNKDYLSMLVVSYFAHFRVWIRILNYFIHIMRINDSKKLSRWNFFPVWSIINNKEKGN